MKRLSVYLLFLLSLAGMAQLSGLPTDSLYRTKLRSLKVKMVREFLVSEGAEKLNGWLIYDTLGRLTELYTMNTRQVLFLDSLGRQYGREFYEKDTAQLSGFYKSQLDEHGHILSSRAGSFRDGKLDSNLVTWKVLRQNTAVCARRWDYPGSDQWPAGYEVEIDSSMGIYHTFIGISYSERNKTQDDQIGFARKTLSRYYRIHDTLYFDQVESKVWPDKEIFEFCQTTYRVLDSSGKQIHEGYLDYDESLKTMEADRVPAVPANAPLPESFVKAILSGELRTKPETKARSTGETIYAKDGRQLSYKNTESSSLFNYNRQNRLSEIIYWCRDYDSRTVYSYDQLGLIVKTRTYLMGAPKEKPVFEYHYHYSFY